MASDQTTDTLAGFRREAVGRAAPSLHREHLTPSPYTKPRRIFVTHETPVPPSLSHITVSSLCVPSLGFFKCFPPPLTRFAASLIPSPSHPPPFPANNPPATLYSSRWTRDGCERPDAQQFAGWGVLILVLRATPVSVGQAGSSTS